MRTAFAPRDFAAALADKADPPQATELESPYTPDYPPSERQEEFEALDCLEAFYGGAAGGGKSDALLRTALRYVHVPGYSALLLRRTYPELSMPGGLMHRSKLWLSSTDAKWSGSGGDEAYTWRFPSGARIVFGHAETEKAILRYYGSEWHCIGWDELTHFPEAWYRLLFSRLRRPDSGPLSAVPLRMRSASNPGGPGHKWVKRRFIEKKPAPGDLSDTPERCEARVFVPAKLADNPGLDQEAYRNSLSLLDQESREQLEDGNWDTRAPGDWVFDHHAIRAAVELGERYDKLRKAGKLPPPVEHTIHMGIDYGDFATVGEVLWPLERGGLYLPPGEVAMSREDLEVITEAFLKSASVYPYWFAEARYDSSFAQSNRTFAKLAEKRLGVHNSVKRKGRPNTYPANFGKYKDLTIRYLRLLLRRTLEAKEAGWPEGQAMTRVLAISPHNEVLCDQLPEYEEGEDGKPVKGNDDAIDALIAGATPLARTHRKLVEAEAKAAGNKGLVQSWKAQRG